jgi:TRAP-type C4-dicarboxylate transport system permease small subunit
MNGFIKIIDTVTRYVNYIAAGGLATLMFLTVGDVILRGFKSAITGTYELVGFLGAVAIGFSFARTGFERHHVSVDTFTAKLSRVPKMIVDILTRCMGMGFFFILGWNLILIGAEYHRTGQVSPTLLVPFYPVAYAVGICSFLMCLVLIGDIVKIFEGKFESQ